MVVEKSIENLERSTVKLSVTVGQETCNTEYQKALNGYANTLKLKGFRKGKLPPKLLENKFGSTIRAEVAEKLLKEALDEIWTADPSIKPLAYSPMNPGEENPEDFSTDRDFKFSVQYEVFPEVPLLKLADYKIEKPRVLIDDEAINKELQAIQERNALVIDKEGAVANGDMALIDFWDASLDPKPEGEELLSRLVRVGDDHEHLGFSEHVLGMQPSEEKLVKHSFPADSPVKEYAGKDLEIKIQLKSVRQKDLPAIDDELAQDVDEKFSTLADLKADIRARLTKDLEREINDNMLQQLFLQARQNVSIEIPKSMLENQQKSVLQNISSQFGGGDEGLAHYLSTLGGDVTSQIKAMAAHSTQQLHSSLLRQKLAEEFKLAASKEDVEEEIAAVAKENNISKEELLGYYNGSENEEKFLLQMQNQCIGKKLDKLIFSEVELISGAEMSLEELRQGKNLKFLEPEEVLNPVQEQETEKKIEE